MVVSIERFHDLDLDGGRLSLDFVNSEGGIRNGPPERLVDYEDLVVWAVYTGALDERRAGRLIADGKQRTEASGRVFERAVALREALFCVFSACLEHEAADPADRRILDDELADALAHLHLVPVVGGFEWALEASENELPQVLWPIARDAAELLSSGTLDRVKECRSKDCAWLYYDESRNRSRRWCNMAECGNRAKARRYYRRHQNADRDAKYQTSRNTA